MPEISITSMELDAETWRKKKIAWVYSVDKTTFLISSKTSRYWNKNALSRKAVRISALGKKVIIDLPEEFYDFYFRSNQEYNVDLAKEDDISEMIIVTLGTDEDNNKMEVE
jgi:hypothetical protein